MAIEKVTDDSEHSLRLRNLQLNDYADLKELMDILYPNMGGAWPEKKFRAQLSTFAEGQICIEDHGKVVAAAFSLIVEYEKFGDKHTYDQITGNAYLTTHDPKGDTLYGIEVVVHPDYQGMRLGRRLYEARKELCQNLNLKSIVAGGRIPNYQDYADNMSPQKYIEQVKKKEIYDPILTFQLSNDFEVKRVLRGYLPEDKESKGYATLLEWNNLYYDSEKTPLFGAIKTSARVGCVQWQMRPLHSVQELIQQVEFFIDALSDYQCDLALLPEFFNAPLMGVTAHDTSLDAIKALAEYSTEIVEEISRLAVCYNINIIAGSVPVIEDGQLYNVSYFCRRNGTIESQYKIHPTPHEKRAWIMQGGDSLNVFETDFGKIGILICYDVEFPELARLQSEKGMQLLFIPFWTDTKNAYLRVRCCAQARAIENECYVVIAGSVGNLPKVDGADIQYAQSAVFSPSDFSFPHDAIMAETTPNTEMTLIVDLDLEKLDKLKNEGSVRNFLDRRRDLYGIDWFGD
ncbi:bifunctional GNAT family N-acetyltransferase/carbon-nitrogen hydrolase family protein [Teredinibacter sp. KSP-S5-2]|uniref:bifunctional GNAT family N-acetyltransferase/carbon-nitrogen hydrolase family protein n=1 Tax=Teredinibacter sp. KSP-S5-2 TaxID=3034506 RepID=UPI0029351E03|nr:bifunctional GNAT family N-acetyltransferase/carbon-nitrogen hydrolase family protein [Teredinibacter sp. KSP-S5-2]WNO07816.1 bifunctional GNAT family N-acetyltransferase/carbon-nitrogen hydrolase family protein [Teredinibacter sp. KSP-S5-2]